MKPQSLTPEQEAMVSSIEQEVLGRPVKYSAALSATGLSDADVSSILSSVYAVMGLRIILANHIDPAGDNWFLLSKEDWLEFCAEVFEDARDEIASMSALTTPPARGRG